MTGKNLLVHWFKGPDDMVWAYAPELPGLVALGEGEHRAMQILALAYLRVLLCHTHQKRRVPFLSAWQPKQGQEQATRILVPATMQQWEKMPSDFPILASSPETMTEIIEPAVIPQDAGAVVEKDGKDEGPGAD